MLGWIIRSCISDPAAVSGDILAHDGKVYTFHAGDLSAGVSCSDLAVTNTVSFIPGEMRDIYPAAAEISIPTAAESDGDEYIRRISSEIRPRLSEKRYMHCFRVAKFARAFAEKSGFSPDRAELAGWLHDIAKENSNEENVRIILESGLSMSSFELQYHHITHAAAGAVIAEREFGIKDGEILNAIRYHSGRPAMGTLEKIIFIADHMDRFYKLGQENLNSFSDLPSSDDVIFRIIMEINRFFVHQRQQPDVITECMMNYMFRQADAAAQSEEAVEAEGSSFISDELFDRAVRINVLKSVGLSSVPNSRELGGYKAFGGKAIRNGCLVRSARLNSMTAEDAEKLRVLGIDTVIDLRSIEEVNSCPDSSTGLFTCCRCPLPTVEVNEYLKNISEKYSTTTDSREKTFYLSEYLSCISMENMYMDVLTDASSVRQIKKVFDILLDESCRGVLFHCTSGKDRTGIVSALIMLALGVGQEDIRSDYYASVVSTFATTEALAQGLRRQKYSSSFVDEVRYFSGIGMNMAEETYRMLSAEYGSVTQYLTDVLGLTEEKLSALRKKYLEA